MDENDLLDDFLNEVAKTPLDEMLSEIFDKYNSNSSWYTCELVKIVMQSSDFVFVDRKTNDARTYIYTKQGNVLSQIMLHNWKGTIWCLRLLFEDDEVRWLEPTNSAHNLLVDGLYRLEKEVMA